MAVLNWGDCVQRLGKWYYANVHTYLAGIDNDHAKGYRKKYTCALLGREVGDDCSSFVCHCLQLAGAIPKTSGAEPARSYCKGGSMNSVLRKAGFLPYSFSKANLQPWDIVAYGKHVEVYAGQGYSYGWGNRCDGQLKSNGKKYASMPHKFYNAPYTIIWRCGGAGKDTPLDLSNDAATDADMTGGYGTGSSPYGDTTSTTYPVHDEYETYSGSGGNIFSMAADNAFLTASMATNDASLYLDSSNTTKFMHTRIYSTNDASIVLDELTLPIEYMNDNNTGLSDSSARVNANNIYHNKTTVTTDTTVNSSTK